MLSGSPVSREENGPGRRRKLPKATTAMYRRNTTSKMAPRKSVANSLAGLCHSSETINNMGAWVSGEFWGPDFKSIAGLLATNV